MFSFVHCRRHRLNLALHVALNQLTLARNCLGTVNSLFAFIKGTAKRHAIFLNFQLSDSKTTFKRVDGTRWSSKDHAIPFLVKTYVFVLETLSHINLTEKSQAG